ncbi:hypothetical protein [Alloscardovia criceti]|uniref:hypothetical protein n=1 Tax=Alloscardovia criceti TaxID=356828 RepID=UPI00037DA0F2|nr:hypothetical protein [Alloscardovia criceti]
MKSLTIITAKIHDDIYERIVSGEKKYEVRNDDFNNASIIRYISARTGEQLGLWIIKETFTAMSTDRINLSRYASVNEKQLNTLFPQLPKRNLHIALLGKQIKQYDIFKEEDYQ